VKGGGGGEGKKGEERGRNTERGRRRRDVKTYRALWCSAR
jgi:hypothetical protein